MSNKKRKPSVLFEEVIRECLQNSNNVLQCVKSSVEHKLGFLSPVLRLETHETLTGKHIDWISEGCRNLAPPIILKVKLDSTGVRLNDFFFIEHTTIKKVLNEEKLAAFKESFSTVFQQVLEKHSVTFKKRKLTYNSFRRVSELQAALSDIPLLIIFLEYVKICVFSTCPERFYGAIVSVANKIDFDCRNRQSQASNFVRAWLEAHSFSWSLSRNHIRGYVNDQELQTWREYSPAFAACQASVKQLSHRAVTYKGQRLDAAHCFNDQIKKGFETAVTVLSGGDVSGTHNWRLAAGLWMLNSVRYPLLKRNVLQQGSWPENEWLFFAFPFVKAFNHEATSTSRHPCAHYTSLCDAVAVFFAVQRALFASPEARDVCSRFWFDFYSSGGQRETDGVLLAHPYVKYAVEALKVARRAQLHKCVPLPLTRAVADSFLVYTEQHLNVNASTLKYKDCCLYERNFALTVRHSGRIASFETLNEWLAGHQEEVFVFTFSDGGAVTWLDVVFTTHLALRTLCQDVRRYTFVVRVWQEYFFFLTSSFRDALAACYEVSKGQCAQTQACALNYLMDFPGHIFDKFITETIRCKSAKDVPDNACDIYRKEGSASFTQGDFTSLGENTFQEKISSSFEIKYTKLLFFKHPASALMTTDSHPLSCPLPDLLEILAEFSLEL